MLAGNTASVPPAPLAKGPLKSHDDDAMINDAGKHGVKNGLDCGAPCRHFRAAADLGVCPRNGPL